MKVKDFHSMDGHAARESGRLRKIRLYSENTCRKILRLMVEILSRREYDWKVMFLPGEKRALHI